LFGFITVQRTNPLQNWITINISDINLKGLQLYIFDLNGKVQDVENYFTQSSGRNEFIYKYSYLKHGAYICQLVANNNLYTSMFMK
jgi:hypothetical protein